MASRNLSQKWVIYVLFASVLLFLLSMVSCDSKTSTEDDSTGETSQAENAGIDQFWINLKEICGQTFSGTVVKAAANDTTFAGKALIMDVRLCKDDEIRIPFTVGEDRSRTWVLKKVNDRILLKHDHRHEDGSEDRITQYGGMSTNTGSETRQIFPADQETVDLIAYAAGNVWWIDLEKGVRFVYNLKRIGTDREFSVSFDLTTPIEQPPAPWGWEFD